MEKNNIYTYILILAMLLGVYSCHKESIEKIQEYYAYMSDEDNGLLKIKSVSGINIKVKFLPIDYLVYNQFKNDLPLEDNRKKAAFKSYENSFTFLLTIGPDENEEFDLTRLGVENYEEFANRIEEMSFHANEWIELKISDNIYYPEIVKMENINAIEKSRNFLVVFNTSKLKTNSKYNEITFIYNDNMFNIGTNKFIFNKKDLNSVPALKF